jgi:hypothetical protein
MEALLATSHTVINNFIRKGFYLLGYGCYAAVFESKTDPNLVYKVGAQVTDPFLAYIKNTPLQGNPHFPRVYSCDVFDSWYLVTMERLDPIPDHKLLVPADIRSIVDGEQKPLKCIQDNKSLQAIAAEIRAMAEWMDVKVDLHQGNIMMRGTVPVITDPLCDKNIYSEWALENWFGQKDKEQRNASWSY